MILKREDREKLSHLLHEGILLCGAKFKFETLQERLWDVVRDGNDDDLKELNLRYNDRYLRELLRYEIEVTKKVKTIDAYRGTVTLYCANY
jgi:hypothetical protein